MNRGKEQKTAAKPIGLKFDRGVITVRDRGLIPFGGFSVLQNIKKWDPGISKREGCELFIFDPGDESAIQSFYPRVQKSLWAADGEWQEAHDSEDYDGIDSHTNSLDVGSIEVVNDWAVKRIFLIFDMRQYDGAYPDMSGGFEINLFPDSETDTDISIQACNISLENFDPDLDASLPLNIFSSFEGTMLSDVAGNLNGSTTSLVLNQDGIDFFSEKIRNREIAVICVREYNNDFLDVDPDPPEWVEGTDKDYWEPTLGSWDDSEEEWVSINLIDGGIVLGLINPNDGLPKNPRKNDRYAILEDGGGYDAGDIIVWDGENWVVEKPDTGTVIDDTTNNKTYVLDNNGKWTEVDDNVTSNSSMLVIYVSEDGWENTFRPRELRLDYDCGGCDPAGITVNVYDKDGNLIGTADIYVTGGEIVITFNGDTSIDDIGRIEIININGEEITVSLIEWLAYNNPFGPLGILNFVSSNPSENGESVLGDGNFIYLTTSSNTPIETFTVDGSGILTSVALFSRANGFKDFATDGNFFYGTSGSGGCVSLSVDGGGNFTELDSIFYVSTNCFVWADVNYVYIGNASSPTALTSYSVDGSGNFTFIDFIDPGATSRAVWGDGNFIYNALGGTGIKSYSVDVGGNFTFIDQDYQSGLYRGIWGDGNYLYVVADNGGLLVYKVDGSGNFTFIDSDYLGGFYNGVWADGNFIYVTCYKDGIRSYSVDAGGYLTFISQDIQYDIYSQPLRYVDVWGDGDFIYTAIDDDDPSILVYSVS